jgi:hypothetical protein
MEVFSLLDSSPIVLTYRIVDFKCWETGSYVKMQIVLIDNSVLHAKLFFSLAELPGRIFDAMG